MCAGRSIFPLLSICQVCKNCILTGGFPSYTLLPPTATLRVVAWVNYRLGERLIPRGSGKLKTGVSIVPGPPQAQSTAQYRTRRFLGRSTAWRALLFYSHRCRIQGNIPLDAWAGRERPSPRDCDKYSSQDECRKKKFLSFRFEIPVV